MSRDLLPEPWRSALEVKGIHSMRGLATKAGLSPQTAKRLIDGTGTPSFETVSKVADRVFGGDRERVWELAGQPRQDHGPWELPEDVVSQLDEEQRAAVLAVARAMLPAEARKRGGSGGDTAAIAAERRLRAVAHGGDPEDADTADEVARRARDQHDKG